MKLLLDTHVFLWFIAGDLQLTNHARQMIENDGNECYLSVATVWEITIKSSLGRLTVPLPLSQFIRDHVLANSINLLPIKLEHFDILHSLPYHHKDPFDRLLLSQAIFEDMVFITKDEDFEPYHIQIEW